MFIEYYNDFNSSQWDDFKTFLFNFKSLELLSLNAKKFFNSKKLFEILSLRQLQIIILIDLVKVCVGHSFLFCIFFFILNVNMCSSILCVVKIKYYFHENTLTHSTHTLCVEPLSLSLVYYYIYWTKGTSMYMSTVQTNQP